MCSSMCSFYVLFLCAIFMCSFYTLFLFSLFSRSFCALFFVLFLCDLFMSPFYALFFMGSFNCACTKSINAHKQISQMTKKSRLSDHRARFLEEKISTDIICHLPVEDCPLELSVQPSVYALHP